jgi:flagellar motor switch protein FliG
MTQRSLRKAAILIAALDAPTADRLLEQMGDEQAARVRSAVMELHDVDPQEQDAILAEFFAGPAPATRRASDDSGVELEVSDRSRQAEQALASRPIKEHSAPFHFLQSAGSNELARRLRGEHPQLLAVVAAHLPAEKSAQFLEHLPAALQDDVIERLALLDDADPEIIAELERELARLFTARTEHEGKRREHLRAILGILRRKSQQKDPPHPVAIPACSPSPPAPAISFEQLLSLRAEDFFAVMNEADPRVTMLALAGAPRRLFERYLAQFPNERALEFERHVEQLRPLRLRDVEAAQQQLAVLAGRRLASAKAAAESSRRFAAAA